MFQLNRLIAAQKQFHRRGSYVIFSMLLLLLLKTFVVLNGLLEQFVSNLWDDFRLARAEDVPDKFPYTHKAIGWQPDAQDWLTDQARNADAPL